MSASPGKKKSLGVAACTAIVVGNMVGSGFYLSPAAVAPYGNLAILAWLVMGGGAICLGLTFAKLAKLAPATGGPYAYTRMAYGDFPGFLIAWGYWISIWTSLPVIAIAFAGAVMDQFPILHNRAMAVVLTVGAIWGVVLVNLRGVKAAGVFAEVTTYSKLLPFGAIALIGLFFIDASHFNEFNPSGASLLGASAALAPLTMFAYLGLESATVPAGDVDDAERTIPRSTILGIAIAALLYVLGTIAVMGVVPREQLVKSVAPFSDAARALGGEWGASGVSVAVVLSSIGALRVDDAMHATRAAVEEGILPGGGVALLRALKAIEKVRTANDDQKIGVNIVRKALSWPARQIAINSGEDGSVVVGKILDKDQYNYGFDAQTGEFGNLVTKGIIDPTKVVRIALQDGASIAGLLITTEAMVAEKPKKETPMPAMPPGGGMDY